MIAGAKVWMGIDARGFETATLLPDGKSLLAGGFSTCGGLE